MTERELLQKAFHVIEIEAPNAMILDEIIACLAQPEPPEPVAWMVDLEDSQYAVTDIDDAQAVDDMTNHGATMTPLYLHPPQEPPGYVLVPIEPTPGYFYRLIGTCPADWNSHAQIQATAISWHRRIVAAAQETRA